jgi:hypothetical protein
MIIDDLFESPQLCPECGGISFSDLILAEKKDACYYKVKASAKVWPSAYASGRLVQCRKKGAGNYGNKSEGVAEGSLEEIDRRGFLKGLGAAAMAGAAGSAMAQSRPVDVSREFQNMRQDDPRVQHNKDIEEMARAIYEQIVATRGQPIDRRQQQMWMTIAREKATEKLSKYAPGRPAPQSQSSRFPAQGSERRVSRNIDNFESQGVAEGSESDAYGNTGEKHECGSCDGTGIVSYDELAKAVEYDDVCPECGGKGWIRDKESLKKQGVAEGLAQDEAEEYSGWRAEFVNEINYNTFEVKLTNTRSKESANFIVRPVDMVSYGPTLSIETMDVHDLQTGQTESWTNDDPAPEGPIAYAISGLFYDDKQLQQKLQNIIDTHDTKGQDMMPGLEKRRSIGQEVDADAYIDSQEKTQAAMAKMKKGVAEKLGDNRPKLGSKRDSGRSIRKWRSARGLDETGVAEGELDEGWKSALGAAALAGTMAMGAGGASARVMPGDDPGINRLTGKPIATQQATDTAPAKAEAPQGFSKEYLQKAANPDRFGRFLISVEKAQELLKQMNEGVAEEAPPGDKAERMVRHIKKSYAKDGKITDKEKGIAYATAWKAHNSGKLEEQNMSDEQATLQAKLQELEKQYDPSFEYSDDYRVWTQQKGIQNQINSIKQQLARLNETAPKEKEADYGDDYQDMVARVKKLAGLGPLKTVYDPAKRVYRNVPTAVQPKK